MNQISILALEVMRKYARKNGQERLPHSIVVPVLQPPSATPFVIIAIFMEELITTSKAPLIGMRILPVYRRHSDVNGLLRGPNDDAANECLDIGYASGTT